MRTIHWGFVALSCAAAACADPSPGPVLTTMRGPVKLLTPASGTRFVQNDPAIGCPSHDTRGYGFRLAFDWDDVPGAYRYDIVLKRVGAAYPAINYHVTVSQYEINWCNTFVIDANLDNWVWSVAAIGPGRSAVEPDTLWSEARQYGFEPCRHADDTPCSAPDEH